jgi:energy-converting hydrogenase A subunit R
VKTAGAVFVTDCEGPISRNDNAFELTAYMIPDGERLFTQLSRYDDVLAYLVKRKGYKAGDTLKLILPFLKAYAISDQGIADFCAKTILLMPGAKELLRYVRGSMPAFIVSTSYEHYLKALCRALGFPFENVFCTRLSLDSYRVSEGETGRLRRLKEEICRMPLIQISLEAGALSRLPESSRQAVRRLDEIFWEEIMQMDSGLMLRETNPMGGTEKARATREIVDNYGQRLDGAMYLGDSITDVECLRLVRANGGLAVAFNGNLYAVREAELAVISPNAMVIAPLVNLFRQSGAESVYGLVDDWSYGGMKKHGVTPLLQERLRSIFKRDLPALHRITPDNLGRVEVESSSFRKHVRGEKVGSLG